MVFPTVREVPEVSSVRCSGGNGRGLLSPEASCCAWDLLFGVVGGGFPVAVFVGTAGTVGFCVVCARFCIVCERLRS